MTTLLSLSDQDSTRMFLFDFFGTDPADTLYFRSLMGLGVDDLVADSRSTQSIMEQLHTDAALLRAQLAPDVDPSNHRTLQRLITAMALLKDLSEQGSSFLVPRGGGERRSLAVLSQASIDYAVQRILTLQPPTRPHDLPAAANSPNRKVERPDHLRPFESNVAVTSSSSSTVTSSDSTSAAPAGQAPTPKTPVPVPAPPTPSLQSFSSSQIAQAINASIEMQRREQIARGAGVGLSSSSSSSSKLGNLNGATPELAAKLRAARLRAELIKTEIEIATLEGHSEHKSVASNSTVGDQVPVLPETPRPKATKSQSGDETLFVGNPSPDSPSPDEATAAMLRAQLEEVESRIKASALIGADPAARSQALINQLRLENELLRRAQFSASAPAGLATGEAAAVPQAATPIQSTVSWSKESESIKIPATMPTATSYKRFRDTIEASVVASSGKAAKAMAYFSDIESQTAEQLSLSCPEEMRSIDAKLACSLRLLLDSNDKNLCAQRLSLEMQRHSSYKFCGRCYVKLFDKEFNFLAVNSLHVASSQLRKISLSGKDWTGVEKFLQDFERLFLQLESTSKRPTNSYLLGLIEEHLEIPLLSAEFALFRSQHLGETGDPIAFIQLIKQRCANQRDLNQRLAPTKASALVSQDVKGKGKGESKRSGSEACRNFLAGKCSYGDKCRFSHNKPAAVASPSPTTNTSQGSAAPAAKAKAKSKAKSSPSHSGPSSYTTANPDNAADKSKVCKYFKAKGKCTKGDSCRFTHAAAAAVGAACIIAAAGVGPTLASSYVLTAYCCMSVLTSCFDASNFTDSDFSYALFAQPFCTDYTFLYNDTDSLNGHSNYAAPSFIKVVRGDGALLDSGASLHLRSSASVSSDTIFQSTPIKFETANGTNVSTTATRLPATDVLPAREARILPGSPDVESLGVLCKLIGYSFIWPGFSDPILITPQGAIYVVPLVNLVPVLGKLGQISLEDFQREVDSIVKQICTARATPSLTCVAHYLLEYCCYEDSVIGTFSQEFGIYTHRLCLKFADLRTDQGLSQVLQLCSELSGRIDIYASLPCGPFSPIQNLCRENSRKKGQLESFEAQLEVKRNDVFKMLDNLIKVCYVIVAAKGTVTAEQSEYSSLVTTPQYTSFESQFHLVRKFINMCTLGLRCPRTALPLLKGHHISSSSTSVVEVLSDSSLICPGKGKHPQHGEIIGGNAELSGRYTPEYARKVLRALAADRAKCAAPAAAGELEVEEVPEDAPSKLELLKAQSNSTQHLFCHLPHNPLCVHCVQGKLKRAQHRRRSDRERASLFAAMTRGDTIFAPPSIEDITCALVLEDDATDAIAAYPSESKSAAACEEAIRHFIGPELDAACIFHSDCAPELISACKSIGINHDPAIAYHPQTHGLEERANQKVIQASRVSLLISGLPVTYWDYAVRHSGIAITASFVGPDKQTAWQRRHKGNAFPGLCIPFGAQIFAVPNKPQQGHKFAASGQEAIFLCYDIAPGLKFGSYTCILFEDYLAGRHFVFKTRDVKIPSAEWKFPIRELNQLALQKNYVTETLLQGQGIGILFDASDDAEVDRSAPAEPAEASSEPLFGDLPPPTGESVPEAPPEVQLWPPRRNSARPPYVHPNVWTTYGPKQRQEETERYQRTLSERSAPGNIQAGGSSSSTARPPIDGSAAVSKLLHCIAELVEVNSQPNLSAYVSKHSHTVSKATALGRPSLEQIAAALPPVEHGTVVLEPMPDYNHVPKIPSFFSLVTRAITRQDPQWNSVSGKKAIAEEVEKLVTKGVFHPKAIERADAVAQDPKAHFTRIMLILGIKFSELEERYHIYKGRAVLRGDRILEADGTLALFSELASAPASLETLRSIILYSLLRGEIATTADAVGAYYQHLLTPDDGPTTYVELTRQDIPFFSKYFPEIVNMKRPCLWLARLLYGHPRAGYIWEKHLAKSLIADKWEPVPNSNQTFVKDVTLPVLAGHKGKSGTTETIRWVLGAYVDDCVCGGKRNREAWASIRAVIETTEPEDISRILSVAFATSADRPHEFMLKQQMQGYCQAVVRKYQEAPSSKPIVKADTPILKYSIEHWQSPVWQATGLMQESAASLLMSLLYLARMCRPDLQFAVVFLARFVTRWTLLSDHMLNRIFSYVFGSSHLYLVAIVSSAPGEIESIAIHGYPDADHGDDPQTNRSTSGNAAIIVGNATRALSHWSSKRQGGTASSTPEAEIVSADKLLRELLIPLQEFWSFILRRDVQCVIYEDNEAAIKILKAGYSLAMRHLARHQRVNLSQAAEMLRDKAFSLVYCPTKEQLADFLTKPLEKPDLQRALNLAGLVSA